MDFQNACSVSHKMINDIPALFVCNRNRELKPIVFAFHQLLQNKESELSIGYKLAKENFFVVVFDLHGHGERKNSYEYYGRYDFNNLYKDIYKTACDIKTVLDYLESLHLETLSFSDIACAGTSIGANAALISGYLNNETKNIVSLIGSMDWEYTAKYNRFELLKYYSFARELMQFNKLKYDILQYNSVNNYSKINTLPRMIFMNGLLDTVSPIESVKLSYDKLKKIYTDVNKGHSIELKIYAKAGHQVAYEMLNNTIQWLKGNKV